MPSYHRAASLLFGRPLLVLPSVAEAIGAYLLSRMQGAGPDEPRATKARVPAASRFDGQSVGIGSLEHGTYVELYRRVGSTAVVTVEGELVNRGAWIGADSGLTSYEGVSTQITRAAIDPKVSSIILDIDSPGGQAVGAFELGSLVHKVNAEKPVTALVDGMAASAAYAMASGAGRIVTIPSGLVGSIGVVLLHLDMSEKLAKAGIAPTLIYAGAHKVDGNPFEALPEAVRTDLQAEVDTFYEAFVAGVAAGRPQLTEAAIRATEARIFMGPAAVAAGLADAVGTLDDVLADFRGGGSARSTTTKGPSMTLQIPEGFVPQAIFDTAIAAARTEGHAAGVTEERARFNAILDSDAAKDRGGAALAIARTGATLEQASAVLAASPASPAAAPPAPPQNRAGTQPLGLVAGMPEPSADNPLKRAVGALNKR
jgi:signal peptide peptidase SppA